MSHIDPYNYAIVKLYADRCKPIILGDKLKTTILTRDLNILKRPLSSIVVLDVVRG